MNQDPFCEIVELAQRLSVDTRVHEGAAPEEGDADVPRWLVTLAAPNGPALEVRCTDPDLARRLVKNSLLELLGDRGLMGEPWSDHWGTEPDEDYEAYRASKARDAEILSEFSTVLEADESEETIQRCMAKHVALWRFVTSNEPTVVPKMRLGEKFVTDFMVLGSAHWSQSQMKTATFVELERPSHKLFTQRGDPSAELVHGLRQLQDWKQWVTDNRHYVRDRFVEHGWLGWERSELEGQGAGIPPFGFVDRYLLVIGRRPTMSPDQRLRLQRMNEDMRDMKIVTYDLAMDTVMPEAPYMPWQYLFNGPP